MEKLKKKIGGKAKETLGETGSNFSARESLLENSIDLFDSMDTSSQSADVPDTSPYDLHSELAEYASQSSLPSSSSSTCLRMTSVLDTNQLCFDSTHKINAMLTLSSLPSTFPTSLPADFTLVLHGSSSLNTSEAISHLKATISFILTRLDHAHRLSIISCNKQIQSTDGLLLMDPSNKEKISSSLSSGMEQLNSPQLDDAIIDAILGMINRDQASQPRISCILIITDATDFGSNLSSRLESLQPPSGLTINTFGYGLSHDSTTLHTISLFSKSGTYYYLESFNRIAPSFVECIAGILSTTAHDIKVRLVGGDGCRMLKIDTVFAITPRKKFKDATIELGSMFMKEWRSVLLLLSLRRFSKPEQQELIRVEVTYTNSRTSILESLECWVSINRSSIPKSRRFVLPDISVHLNRYRASKSIFLAIIKANKQDFSAAIVRLLRAKESILRSSANHDGRYKDVCEDLLKDLAECENGMEAKEDYDLRGGRHYCIAYSLMHFMERANGCRHLRGIINKHLYNHLDLDQPLPSEYTRKRAHQYGYATSIQQNEADMAVSFVTKHLSS